MMRSLLSVKSLLALHVTAVRALTIHRLDLILQVNVFRLEAVSNST